MRPHKGPASDMRIFSSRRHPDASNSTDRCQTLTVNTSAVPPPRVAAALLIGARVVSYFGGQSGDSGQRQSSWFRCGVSKRRWRVRP